MARVFALALLLLSSSAQAQLCDLTGADFRREVRVHDADGRRFVISVHAAEVFATLRRRKAHLEIRGYLEFSAEMHIDDLGLALARATTLSPMLHIGSRSDVIIQDAFAHDELVRSRLEAGPFVFDGVELSCQDLVIDDERKRLAYNAGFVGRPHFVTVDVDLCSFDPEIRAQHLAYRQGLDDKAAFEQRGAVDRDPGIGYWELNARPFEIRPSAYGGGDVLRVAAATSSRTVPDRRWGDTHFVSRTAGVTELERRRDRARIRFEWGASVVEGWIRGSMVRGWQGNGFGYGGGGGSGSGYGIPAGSPSEAVIRVGAPVFASPRASMPWARVGGMDSVRVETHGEWSRIISIKSLESERSVFWVRSADVTHGQWSQFGLHVAMRPAGAFREEIEVVQVHHGTTADAMGFRVGDIVLSDVGVNIPHWVSRAARVRRHGEQLVLRNPCEVTQSAEFDEDRQAVERVLTEEPGPNDTFLKVN